MRKALVGYTGFVGSNIAASSEFQGLYNSRNISRIYDQEYDLVIYAGVLAEKFIANQEPDKDKEHIDQTIETIRRIRAKKFVLISTVDVCSDLSMQDEFAEIVDEKLQPYGRHRFLLEKWVRNNVDSAVVVRLPALYGQGLKKNFIFDAIQIAPTMIKSDIYTNMKNRQNAFLDQYYSYESNGFYKLRTLGPCEKQHLKEFFMQQKFNALSFTDSRNEYQYYPLSSLWNHIQVALENDLKVVCLNSEPISAAELYRSVFGQDFVNLVTETPLRYNFRSKFFKLFDGNNGYIFNKPYILADIKKFIMGQYEK